MSIEKHSDGKARDKINKDAEKAIAVPRRTEQEIIAERQSQRFSSRLAEYITGLKPEDPSMLERLVADKAIIRTKYNLPSKYLPPSEFERALLRVAKDLKVRIKSRSECGKLFEENPLAGAMFQSEANEIAADINKKNLEDYRNSLHKLEHELIHVIQHKKFPTMPVELSEYEAYVADLNMAYLREHPEDIDSILFNFLIGGSVNMNYRLQSEKRGEKVVPIWDKPEYFLKNDGIDLSKI